MKITSLHPLALLLLAASLTSCYVPPVGPAAARRPHSPYSPGGRYVTPSERYVHSPRSPGGRAVTPGEVRASSPYSPGGTVVLPGEARRITHRGQVYYTHRNVWYRPAGRGYVIVQRPY